MRPTLDEMEALFNDAILPDGPIRDSVCSEIIDPARFIESHFNVLRGNPGNKRMLPYYERLEQFYWMVKTGNFDYLTLKPNENA